jgi:nucleoside-diphosphate-sugar epimerase
MRVLVIGSEGFIGEALVARLVSQAARVGGSQRPVGQVTLLDRCINRAARPDHVRVLEGDICDRRTLENAVAGGADCVFHLASIPGGAAERDFELGLRVNLMATLELMEVLRRLGTCPKLVFASSIAVYGVPMPDIIDEDLAPAPSLSYGTQKLIGELLIDDYGRRGFVDGRAVRIPGIVARPPAPGMLSIFLSDLIRELSAGRPVVCPVSPDAPSWWLSRPAVIDNLFHASNLGDDVVRTRRSFLLPAMRLTMAEVAAAIGTVTGRDTAQLIRYEPNATLQAQFANYPPMRVPKALAAGFRNDGTAEALVTRALESFA